MRHFVGVILGLLLAACAPSPLPPLRFAATDISGAPFGAALTGFRDHHGAPFGVAAFKGRALLVFFGYTFCPDVCPTTLTRFAELMKRLGDDAKRVQVVFVTLDPQRDTARQLAGYVPWFDPTFIGIYADDAATEAAAREFKVYFSRRAGSSAGGYSIDHSAGAYVFDPAGRVRLYVKDDVPIAAIAADLRLLLAGN
jgi:protein SCO1/2